MGSFPAALAGAGVLPSPRGSPCRPAAGRWGRSRTAEEGMGARRRLINHGRRKPAHPRSAHAYSCTASGRHRRSRTRALHRTGEAPGRTVRPGKYVAWAFLASMWCY